MAYTVTCPLCCRPQRGGSDRTTISDGCTETDTLADRRDASFSQCVNSSNCSSAQGTQKARRRHAEGTQKGPQKGMRLWDGHEIFPSPPQQGTTPSMRGRGIYPPPIPTYGTIHVDFEFP
eukprot:gene11209-biopygen2304